METTKNLEFIKDVVNKKIIVIRHFDAPVDHVWRAWTESELLDQWWAPKPWKAETKSIDLRAGGSWLYAMVGPDNEKHSCRVDYKSVDAPKSFSGDDYFCDENFKKNAEMPTMHWRVDFQSVEETTKVTVTITFDKVEDIETITKMGFQEGFTAALGNLDELLLEEANK